MALTPVVPLAGRPDLWSASRTGRDVEVPVCEQVPCQEAATRTVRHRWSDDSRVPIGSRLLWGMALLSLLLLPTDCRAGAEARHGHSLVQLLADARDGRIDHHGDHEHVTSGPVLSTSWIDPALGEMNSNRSSGPGDERPDIAAQQESVPVAGGIDLLVTAMAVTASLGMIEVPQALSDRTRTGLPARVLVPPPRWTATT